MLAAAAEDSGKDLFGGRGDAYCGMLSASYNVGLRRLKVHLPSYPVGTPAEVAVMIRDFIPVARVALGLRNLKIFSFGPRPHDFLTCHAPIQPLFDLGVEVMENSELDMYDLFQQKKGDPRIKAVAADMAKELGRGNTYPDLLEPLAQFELALLDYMEKNLGRHRMPSSRTNAGRRSRSTSASRRATSTAISRSRASRSPANRISMAR